MKTAFVSVLALSFAAHAQTTYFVDKTASGTGDGLSWDNAFTNLHDAFGSAGHGDTVRVAQGTYLPDEGGVPGDRTEFWHYFGGAIEGGYQGLAAPSVGERDDRDTTNHPTILSGDIGTPGDPTDNSFRLIWTQTALECRFDGLTIADCFHEAAAASAAGVSHPGFGGAVSLLFANTHVFNDVTFRDNYMFNDLTTYKGGPGLFCYLGQGTMDNCRFIDNTLVSSTQSNTVGGAMYLFECDLVVSDSLFHNNQNLTDDGTPSNWGGAVYLEAGYDEFHRCTFTYNTADGWVFSSGGAIFQWVNSSRLGNLLVQDCHFEGNFAQQGSCLWLWESRDENNRETRRAVNTRFVNNDAAGSNGGAIFLQPGTPIEVFGCEMTGNTIDAIGNPNNITGSGICHIANSTLTRDDPGASVRVSDLTIDNSIVRGEQLGNQPPVGGSQFSPVLIRNSNISDLATMPTDMLTTVDCIDEDPMFADEGGGDYRLQTGSPSIDTGDDALVPSVLTQDLDGNARIAGAMVDMGAYEVPSACAADWNGDGDLFTNDFIAYLNDYNAVLGGGSPVYGDPDLAAPIGVLNTADMLAYLNLFTGGCP